MAALTVEYLKVLMVEHLKVMAALWSSLLTHPLPWGRVPKGDGGLNSRACLRILSLGVEYLSSPLGSST